MTTTSIKKPVFTVTILEDNQFYGSLLQKVLENYFRKSGIANHCMVHIHIMKRMKDFYTHFSESTDVMLVDLNIEGECSALPVIEMAKEKTAGRCKVFVMSADGSPEIKSECKGWGAEDFFVKDGGSPLIITGLISSLYKSKQAVY